MTSYTELIDIWGNIKAESEGTSSIDIKEYQKRLNEYFHVGPFYFYVFNVPATIFEFISGNIVDILGYDPNQLQVSDFIEKIHPEDISFFVQCENAVVEFSKTIRPEQLFDYKFSYDYRVRKLDGKYIRILQQVITIALEPETEKVQKTLGIHTDITHIKSLESGNKDSVLSFIGLNGEKSYTKTRDDLFGLRQDNIHLLSERQKQIVSCLMNGMTSQEISEKLFISKHTVDTHRRNILQILGVTNTQQLIIKLSQTGWM